MKTYFEGCQNFLCIQHKQKTLTIIIILLCCSDHKISLHYLNIILRLVDWLLYLCSSVYMAFYPVCFSQLGSRVIFCISPSLLSCKEGSIWNKETVLNEIDS